jgi:hypothetical protein
LPNENAIANRNLKSNNIDTLQIKNIYTSVGSVSDAITKSNQDNTISFVVKNKIIKQFIEIND